MSTELAAVLADFQHTNEPRAYATIEKALLDALNLPYRHVPDDETQDYDAILTHSIHPAEYNLPGSQIVFPTNTRLEIKTCQEWITDNGNHNNRRRGRFHIKPSTHAKFDGAYLFVVISEEQDGLRAVAIIDHKELDSIVNETRTNQGTGSGMISTIPWTRILTTTEY